MVEFHDGSALCSQTLEAECGTGIVYLEIDAEGVAGGGAATVVFVIVSWWSARNIITPEGEQASAFFGDFSIGYGAYAGVVAVIVMVGALTAMTTRVTVLRALHDIDDRRADPGRLD